MHAASSKKPVAVIQAINKIVQLSDALKEMNTNERYVQTTIHHKFRKTQSFYSVSCGF